MELRDTIDLLAASRDRQPTADDLSPKALVEAWAAAVPAFFARVQQVYLIEFLIMGQIGIEIAPIGQYAPGVGHYTIDAMRVDIGGLAVTLSPRLAPASDHQGVLLLQAAGETRQRVELLCDLRGGEPRWTTLAREQGLRRLVSRYLPTRLETLDENRFKDALNEVLIGDQPVFLVNKEGLRARFLDTVDRLTSPHVRADLARTASLGLTHLAKGTLLKASPKIPHSKLPMLEAPDKGADGPDAAAWPSRERTARLAPPVAPPTRRNGEA